MHEDETTQLPTTIVPEPPTGPANGKTVLIAEDDPFIARMYDVKLRSEGYAVVLRNNGREAYEAIKLQRPDLIMLDLNMPELTGQELLAALGNDNFDFSACPIFVLTNSSQDKDKDLATHYGADYYIKAELTPHEIVEKINKKLSPPPTG